jgi:hypothetical protein
MNLQGKMKHFFFDRQRVISAVDKGVRNVLSRFGAFVRTRARSSIRSRKGVSAPGSPPSSHTGILKRFLYFAYDPTARSVVIGPEKTNQVFFSAAGQPVRGTVPEVLEEGGQVTVMEIRQYGRWYRADLRSRRRLGGLPTRKRTSTIKARPYMGPAFEREKQNLPNLWANSIK